MKLPSYIFGIKLLAQSNIFTSIFIFMFTLLRPIQCTPNNSCYKITKIVDQNIKQWYKRGSRGAARAAKSLRWRV